MLVQEDRLHFFREGIATKWQKVSPIFPAGELLPYPKLLKRFVFCWGDSFSREEFLGLPISILGQ
jgi:hypothetical protein